MSGNFANTRAADPVKVWANPDPNQKIYGNLDRFLIHFDRILRFFSQKTLKQILAATNCTLILKPSFKHSDPDLLF